MESTNWFGRAERKNGKLQDTAGMSQLFPTLKSTEVRPQGRRECGCYGTEHRVLTNCTSCGRIHCVEEGMGKCLFCGARMEIIRKMEGYQEAEERADRLLYYQETQTQRTVVREMTGEDPLKLDVWCKEPAKRRQPAGEERRCVQYADLDVQAVCVPPDEEEPTEFFGLDLPTLACSVEVADPDD